MSASITVHVRVAHPERAALLLRDVLRLRVAERPDLVGLQALAGQVDDDLVHVLGARLADLNQEAQDALLVGAGEPTGRSNRYALAKAVDDLSAPGRAEVVHWPCVRARASIVNSRRSVDGEGIDFAVKYGMLRGRFEATMKEQLHFDYQRPILQLWTPDEIFARADGDTFRALGEDRRVERKPAGIQPRELGTYLSMFANTPPVGGVIVVGMEDDGRVSGCASLSTDRLNDLERCGYTHCPDARYEPKRIPAKRTSDGGDDFLLLLRVEYRQDKVVETTSGQAYVRRGESRTILREDEKRELQVSKGQVSLEREPCELKYPDDFDMTLVHAFAESFRMGRGLTGDQTDEEILMLRHLGKKEHGVFVPNVACALLFARDPATIAPGCKIRFLRFEGTTEKSGTKYNVVKDIWIEGNIPHIIMDAEPIIDAQVRDFTRLGTDGKFYTAPEYPKDAWYEAVVNACVHRSYGLKNMNIYVKMFDDRLEIESPGGFMPMVNPDNIYESHHPRNPFLMEALYYLNYVKCAAEGTKRIRDTMLRMNLPAPEFEQKELDASRVRVTLRNNVAHRKAFVDSTAAKLIGEDAFKKLDEEERMLINYVTEHESMNVTDAQRIIGRTWAYARKRLVGLAKKGMLRYEKRPHLTRDTKARFLLKAKRPSAP